MMDEQEEDVEEMGEEESLRRRRGGGGGGARAKGRLGMRSRRGGCNLACGDSGGPPRAHPASRWSLRAGLRRLVRGLRPRALVHVRKGGRGSLCGTAGGGIRS